MQFFLSSLLLVGVASGCISETKEESQEESYFSVTEFMDQEIERYNEGNWVLYKKGQVNDNNERDTVAPKDSTAWRAELDLIYQSNINKPAYQGMYEISRDSSGGKTTTLYKAKKEKLGVQRFLVMEDGDVIQKIEATIKVDNVVYQSKKEFTYFPDSLYRVNASQSVMTSDKEEFVMEMRFVKSTDE